jgi:hypothetical protein
MDNIKPLAIPAPRAHHDLRLPDVGPGAASGERSTTPGERAAHARRDVTRPVGARPTRTMQRQLIARMVG